MSLLRKLLVLVAFVALTTRAEAIPLLQLDIIGGTYNDTTDTTVATTGTFTLRALLTPGASATPGEISALLADTYYISAALTPPTSVGGSLGSFNFAGTPVNVTADMTYGTPPLDATPLTSEDDLPGHGQFPTYFSQFSFSFLAANTVTAYNVEPGSDPDENGRTAYFADFLVTASLTGSNAIHFDLYDSILARCGSGPPANRPVCTPEDIDLGNNAPFSHDAQSGPNTFPDDPPTSVPEPASFMLISLGAVGAAAALRRRRA